MDKSKLIIFGDNWDVYLTAYKDLIDDPRITYIPSFRPKGLLGQLQRLQYNPKVNHIVSLPYKHLWTPYYLRHEKGEKYCFLIMEHWLRYESGLRLLPYLRKTYPKGKIVCFIQDLIETVKDQYTGKQIDVKYIKHYTDLLISFDEADAIKHEACYHPTVFSLQAKVNQSTKYDLYFLGRDKGRLKMLLAIAQEAKIRNISCKFVMLEVPLKDRIEFEGIVYSDKDVSYQENLAMAAESRCIIELLQQKASSPTFRTWEAIAQNRKLMTNNQNIKASPFYDKNYISVFHDELDLDWTFIKNRNIYTESNPYQERISPIRLVEFMEEKLGIKIDHT